MYNFAKLSPNEKLIIFSQSISTVGDVMALPAFLNLALLRGEEVVSLFLIFNFLPRIAQPFIGSLVDNFNPKKIIIVSEIVRSIIFLILFIYPQNFPTTIWLILPLISSFFACVFEPARLKIMSQFNSSFAETNATFYFFYSATGIISIILSLLIEKYADTRLVFLLNALTFLISWFLLKQVKYKCLKSTKVKLQISLEDFWQGFAYFQKYKILIVCTGFIVVIDLFTGVLYELFPEKSIAIGFEHYGTYIFSFLICVGNTIGSLLIPIVYKKLGTIPLLALIIALNLNVFFLSNNYVWSFLSCLLFFILQMIAIGISEIAIQEKIPEQVQGRLFAINESLPVTALSVGSILSGMTNVYILGLLAIVVFTTYIFTLGKRMPKITPLKQLISK